jgi:tRNA (guanine10-N2)-dimethyltransferase
MDFIFELSKEHPTLPKDEVLSCLKAEGIKYSIIDSNDDVLVVESEANCNLIKRMSERLSFTFKISKLLFSCSNSLDEIKNCALNNPIDADGSIAITYKNRSKIVDSQKIVNILADIYTKGKTVNLTSPDFDIHGLITDSKIYIGLKIARIDRSQFEKRKVQNRPFFSPISLHPKLARALVNLSEIKKNETLLDPFCGTGGIILEAGLIGVKTIGSDIEEKMIEGCKKTLDFYKVKNYKLYHSDIGKIGTYIDKVDSIVTDLPYGKSTTTKGEKKELLYNRAFESMSKLLKNGGRAVVGLSNEDFISLGENYFSLIGKHDFRVHSSLIRYFNIYEK